MQATETDRSASDSSQQNINLFEQIDNALVESTLQEEVERYNQWRNYRVLVELILSKWNS